MTDETVLEEDAPAPELSLREELAAALDGQATDADPGAQASPQSAETAAQAAQRVRDEQGRFAKAGETVQNTQKIEPNAPLAPAAAAPKPPSGPPATWSATAKAEFTKASPVIQQEVLRREAEMDQGRAQWQQGAERLNRLDEILAPRRERFQLAGIDENQAVKALFAAQDYLERDPVNALMYLARQSGVDFRALAGAMANQQPQPAQLPPALQQLAQQVQTLTNVQAQQQHAAEQARRTEHQTVAQAFAADPKNVYFENVKGKMANLLKSGEASTLEDAYAQATWADPTIRELLIRQQTDEQRANAQQQARAKAAQARAASGSVIGSTAPGATPGGGPAPSLREELQQAWNASA